MGVEIFWSFKPLGRTRSSRILPTGSGNATTSRKPLAIAAMRLSSSLRRSSMADERPDFSAASRSSALADLMASAFFSSAAAIASRHEFFPAVVSWASSRDATLACRASRVICSFKVMQKEGKPKSQSEKCEVSSALRKPVVVFSSPMVRQTGRIDSAIIAKLLPKNGERVSTWTRMVVT